MSVPVEDRRARFRSALSALLAVALLVPVGILFSQVWDASRDDISAVENQQDGIDYLASLGQLLTATTEAQAATIQGRGAGQEALERAVAATSEVDQRLGAELGTSRRWENVSARIAELPGANGNPQEAYARYAEVTDLLLALYGTVRENSGLGRSPEDDTFYLQRAVTNGLPSAVVQAARLADLTLLSSAPGAPRPNTPEGQLLFGQAAAAGQGVNAAVDEMTDDLQEAVDETGSRTLSGNLLGVLERFRRGVDNVVLAATGQGGAGPEQLPAARAELQTAAAELTATMLRELDALLEERLDDLRMTERLALATLLAALLLAAAAVLLPLLARRRRGDAARTSGPGTPATTVLPPDSAVANGAAARGQPDGPRFVPQQYGADLEPARWERSDVVR